jgi:hypothetical protein
MNEIKKLEGIEGWLIVFAISLFVGLARSVQSLLMDYGVDPSMINPTFRNIMTFESVGVGIGSIFLIIIIFNFFQRKKRIVYLITYYYIYVISYAVLDGYLITSYIDDNAVVIVPIAGNMISAAIWISYFQRSIRVKNTFIND